jgi:hypothetical protein
MMRNAAVDPEADRARRLYRAYQIVLSWPRQQNADDAAVCEAGASSATSWATGAEPIHVDSTTTRSDCQATKLPGGRPIYDSTK